MAPSDQLVRLVSGERPKRGTEAGGFCACLSNATKAAMEQMSVRITKRVRVTLNLGCELLHLGYNMNQETPLLWTIGVRVGHHQAETSLIISRGNARADAHSLVRWACTLSHNATTRQRTLPIAR